ncbi:MAG: F0F1 ATP synthase subunit B' [Rhodospirillales bacterium]|jgi:F-type H+-transporting ATPase subunit b|nr:F0F1 ATP synthase subunit B' [Rhodospirillales bacterium]HJO73282.1 F0F1 ATP synthase subunit B' [Rhodospirillales bacterium]
MHTVLTQAALLVAALGAGTGPALAAGLPQLDTSKYPSMVIWLAISFAVLYVLMARVALPRIARVLEERQDRIDDNLGKAASLKADAKIAAEAYEKALADARDQAQEILHETSQRLTTTAAKRHAEVAERLAGEIDAAEERIARAKQEALSHVGEMVADVVGEAAAKLLGEATDEKAVNAALEATLRGRR